MQRSRQLKPFNLSTRVATDSYHLEEESKIY